MSRSARYKLSAVLGYRPDGQVDVKTVRRRGGKIAMTDGPFAERKEVLGGFIFLEARDMDEAPQIAVRIPMAKHGSVEVRPEMSIG
jgi:hypothetical protein